MGFVFCFWVLTAPYKESIFILPKYQILIFFSPQNIFIHSFTHAVAHTSSKSHRLRLNLLRSKTLTSLFSLSHTLAILVTLRLRLRLHSANPLFGSISISISIYIRYYCFVFINFCLVCFASDCCEFQNRLELTWTVRALVNESGGVLKMPGIAQRNEQLTNGAATLTCSLSANGFWSKNSDDISYNQLQKVLSYCWKLNCFFGFGFWIVVGSLFCVYRCVNSDGLIGFILDLTVEALVWFWFYKFSVFWLVNVIQ